MLRKRSETESNLSTIKVRRKLSYGWVVAIAGAIIVLAGGNFLYIFGVFFKPLIYQFGWSRAAISGCVTIRNIMSGVAAPIAGTLSDKYGPRKIILTGIFLVGLSYLLASRINSLWQLYLFLGTLTGIGIAALFIPIMATATRWFNGKSALANGIILSGFGWAQIILPPVATYLILQYSWETCFIILGIATLVLGTTSWSFIRTPPSTTNAQAEATQEYAPKASETLTGVEGDYTLSKALHTPALWILYLIQVVVAASYQMVIVHIIAAAIDIGITLEAAAIILTLNGITNTLGRLTLGGLATKIGNKTALILCLAIQVLALFLLARTSDLYTFYIIAAIYGLGYGGTTAIMPTLAGSFFGTKSIGSIYGTVNTAYTVGAAIGPLLAGYIFDITGSYSTAFSSAAIAMAVVFLLCLVLKPPQRKAPIT